MARRRAKVTGQHPQQRRFAGAVGADDRDHFASRDTQVDRVDQRRAADRHRDAENLASRTDGLGFEKERRSETSPRCRNNMPRKNGAPIAAVRMPIGMSAGATMVRASGTHHQPGAQQHRGRQQQPVRGPITSRSRCGTTMPTNPTTPQTETATPVMADTSTIEIRFSSTSTPL